MAQPAQHQSGANLRAVMSGNVRALLGRHQVSQTTLASVLNLSQPSLSSRLRNETPWKIDELETIAAYFNVPITRLLLEDDAMNPCSCDACASTSTFTHHQGELAFEGTFRVPPYVTAGSPVEKELVVARAA